MTPAGRPIRAFDYLALLPEIEEDVLEAVRRTLRSGHLVLGPETEAFEAEFARWLGARHCVAMTSGTAALHAALLALGVGAGDEVVTVANTCAPTISAIRLAGAVPVFVDVREGDLQIDPAAAAAALGPRTRCVLPVHLWGLAADADALRAAADARGIPVLEDCAQAHGTLLRGRAAGTLGRAACFSFYPTKNIGALGEGGAVVTDDADLARRLRLVRMYGYDGSPSSVIEGGNFRIAEMQAAILRVKIRVADAWLARRRAIAGAYLAALPFPGIEPVRPAAETRPSWHQFVVRCVDREASMRALAARSIGHGIHYPVPCHRMPAFARFAPPEGLPVTEAAAREILSLPCHEAMEPADADAVAAALRAG